MLPATAFSITNFDQISKFLCILCGNPSILEGIVEILFISDILVKSPYLAKCACRVHFKVTGEDESKGIPLVLSPK